MSIFIKTLPVGGVLFHAERRADMMKLIVTFRNFAQAPRNGLSISLRHKSNNSSAVLSQNV